MWQTHKWIANIENFIASVVEGASMKKKNPNNDGGKSNPGRRLSLAKITTIVFIIHQRSKHVILPSPQHIFMHTFVKD